MRRLIAAVAALFLLSGPAFAQTEGATYQPGNAATRSSLQGCIYRASPPTPAVDGQQMAAGCDAAGNMTISVGTGTAAQQVQGAIAAGASPLATNPFPIAVIAAGNSGQFVGAGNNIASTGNNSVGSIIGCQSLTTLPTMVNGTYGPCQMTTDGSIRTTVAGPNSGTKTAFNNTVSFTYGLGSITAQTFGVSNFNFNGTTQDAQVSIVGAVVAGNAGTGTLAVEEAGRTFTNITTATTTTVKSGKGFLHTLCINTDTASATVTAFDNTVGSGSKIFTITNPAALLSMGPLCATYDIAFTTGLTLVTTGTQDITVSWR